MNLRAVLAGLLLMILAVAFFLYMENLIPRSNDPAGMMRTVGEVSGGGVGLGAVIVLFGLFRRKRGVRP